MAKNRNGMGSIRQRSDGRYEGRYTGSDGHQHSVFGKTSKECTAKLKAALSAVDGATWTAPSKMTVSQWLDEWRRSYCTTIKPTSMDVYTHACSAFADQIGSVKLTRLEPAHIMHAIGMIGSTMAASSVGLYLRILNAALNDAVRVKLIGSNPAAGISAPKAAKPVMHIIDRPMLPAFYAAIEQLPCRDLLIFLLATGLRIGEAFGLQWGDVDRIRRTVTVCRQLNRFGDLTTPKSGESRTIYVSDDVLSLIDRQPRVSVFVFGSIPNRAAVSRNLAKIGVQIGLPGLHPHDLRHSYAVAALRAGVDVKTVQHNLGHATAAMTLDVYAAYTDDAGQQAADCVKKYLGSF